MTDLPEPITESDAVASGRRSILELIIRNPLALSGLVVLVLLVLMAVFAGALAPHDPVKPSLQLRNAPPGTPGHLLGGDGAGRDILSRLLHGSQLTLLGAALAVLVAIVLGVPTGLASGYVGHRVDAALSWVSDVLLSVPGMVLLLAVIAAFGSSVLITMSAFGVVLAPHLFRLVRALTLGVRDNLYIDAARVAGLSDTRIVARHILYVVRAPTIIQSSYLGGIAIIVQSGLEFLGLGGADEITWGAMLNNAFAVIYQAPSAMYWPGALMGFAVASLLLFGTGLRDAIERTQPVKRRRDRVPREVRPTVQTAADADDVDATAALRIEGLRVGYPQETGEMSVVVEDVDLHVAAGEVLGLVGESGSGKTQTAFAAMGLLPCDGRVLAGRITVNGRDVSGMDSRERRSLLGTTIAYVPQEPMSNLDPAFRIGQQLVEPLRVGGMKRREARERALALLDEVGIPDPRRTFDAYPHQVSGGMAQRVLIAGAISRDPVLLIADEPTTALDVTIQAEILSLLRRLQHGRELAVLLVTHNLGVVADLCDTVTVMERGRTVESAPVQRLFGEPQHDYTRMLLAANLDDAAVRPPLPADDECAAERRM